MIKAMLPYVQILNCQVQEMHRPSQVLCWVGSWLYLDLPGTETFCMENSRDGFPSPVCPNSHLSVLVFACFYSNAPLIQLVIWKLLEFLFRPGTLEDWRFKHLLPERAEQSYCFMGPVEGSFPTRGLR